MVLRFTRIFLLLIFTAGLWLSPAGARPAKSAPRLSASELIAAVNGLRAASGLPSYKTDSALMAAAQAHSDFQAESSSATHTGKGGSTPKGRAVAYGYGGGAAVNVTENIATGMNMSASQAVGIWQGDSLHLNTMLNPGYTDVGAGVAFSGDQVYFTLLAGSIAGEAGSGSSANGNSTGGTGGTTSGSSAPAVLPITLSTPKPDGMVVHVVEEGQALWNIAAAYKISLADLYGLNNLTAESMIFPGEKLTIRRAGSGTPMPEQAASSTGEAAGTQTTAGADTPRSGPPRTATPQATATRRPTRTPMRETPTPVIVVLNLDPPTERPRPAQPVVSLNTVNGPVENVPERPPFKIPTDDPVLLVVVGLVAAGAALLLVGVWMRRSG